MTARTKLLAWTGPIFAVIFVVIGFVLEGNTPGEKSSPEHVMAYYNDHKNATSIDAFLGPLGAALLILFFCYLRNLARDRDGVRSVGPTVMVGGAVLWASGLLLGSMINLALVTASDNNLGQVAQTANVLNNDSWIPFIGGIAITLIGAGMTVLGSGLVPRWLGLVALIVGILSLAGPGGFLGFFVAPVWMLVVGIMLARSPERAVAG